MKTLIATVAVTAGLAAFALPALAGSYSPAVIESTVEPAAVFDYWGCEIVPANGDYESPNYWVSPAPGCVPGGADGGGQTVAAERSGQYFAGDQICDRAEAVREAAGRAEEKGRERVAQALSNRADRLSERGMCESCGDDYQ